MKSNKLKLIVSIIIGILICACIIRILIPNKSYDFNINGEISSDDSSFRTSVCEGISLPAGIYKVTFNYLPVTDDMPIFINLEDGSVFSGGFLCDGSNIYSGTDKAEFTLSLYESTEALSAYLDVGVQAPPFQYTGLSFHETNMLWSVYIVNLLFLWGISIAIITFFQKIKAGKISNDRKLEIIVLSALTLIGAIYFLLGKIPSGADQYYHLERLESVAYSIRDGVFPIRLEPYFPFNYGYAGGLFYCDISFYFPALLRIAGFSMQSSFNIFGIICTFAGILSTYYVAKKIFGNMYIGFLASALNNLAMYYAFDTVVRGGTGALVSSIFFPILLYGYYRLFTEDTESTSYKNIWIPISIGYTGVMCSHVLSMEISALWTVILLLTMLPKVFRKKTFIELWKALGAFIVLNLWFIFPFLDYYINEDIIIKNVSARKIQEWGFVFSNYVRLPFNISQVSEKETVHNVYLLFNPVVLVLLVVFLVLWICGAWKTLKNKNYMKVAKLCCIYSIISIVLSLQIFPWDYLHSLNPIFEKIVSALQFPHRFIAYLDLFSAVTVCGLFAGLWEIYGKIWRYVLAVITFVSIIIYSLFFIEFTTFETSTTKLYDMSLIRAYLAGAEYANYGTSVYTIRPWICAKGSDGIEVTSYQSSDLRAEASVINSNDEDGYVDFPLLHYRDYRAFDDNHTELSCIKSDEFYVRVIVPSCYAGNITVRFISPWTWRICEVISYISWILFAIYIIRKKKEAK